MNLFHKEGHRLRLPVAAFALTLFAWQALSMIGASTASAAAFPAGTSCTYASGVLTVSSTAAATIGFQVAGDGSGRILVGGLPGLTIADTTLVQCAGATSDATVASTTSIQVIGDGTTAQNVVIYMYKLAPSLNTTSWGTSTGRSPSVAT